MPMERLTNTTASARLLNYPKRWNQSYQIPLNHSRHFANERRSRCVGKTTDMERFIETFHNSKCI